MKGLRNFLSVIVVLSIILGTFSYSVAPVVAEKGALTSAEILPPPPLDPMGEAVAKDAQRRLETLLRRTPPEPVEIGEILPPGTLPNPLHTPRIKHAIYLPIILKGVSSVSAVELALPSTTWDSMTEGWAAHENRSTVVRYPATWRKENISQGFRVTGGDQVIEVTVKPTSAASVPTSIASHREAGYDVHPVTVKGIRGWEVFGHPSTAEFCREVILQVFGLEITFTLESTNSACVDSEVFGLMLSSLQFVLENAMADTSTADVSAQSPIGIAAVTYDRIAAYNYAYNWYDVFDNDDGYHFWCGTPEVDPPCDGAHFLAHIMQAGGLPIHWNAGQDHGNPVVSSMSSQRTHVLGTGWAFQTDVGNLETGDMVYYRPYWYGTETYCWGAAVVDPNGGEPLVAVHSINVDGTWHAGAFGYRYDSFRCPLGTAQSSMRYNAVKIDTPIKLTNGLDLSPSAQQTAENVTADFTIHNYGGAVNLQVRARVDGTDDFATRSINLGSGSNYTYSEARSFTEAGTYQVCAQINDGSGWVNISPEGTTTSACRTLDILNPEDIEIQINSPLVLDPEVVEHPGGDVQATFSVIHADNSGAGQTFIDDFRAHVDKGDVQFSEVQDITLNPGDEYTYDQTAHFTEPDLYEVKAEHRVVSAWTALLGEGSAILRVLAPKPSEVENKLGEACTTCRYWGDPVNTATGNYAYDFTDMSDPTPGLSLAATRWHNTLQASDIVGPFGYGSSWLYGTDIEWRADKTAVLRMYDGHTVYFVGDVNPSDPADMSGIYHNQNLDPLSLRRNADGTGVLIDERDQTTYEFDANGRLTRISDTYPSEITLSYSGERLTEVAHSHGVIYTISYNLQGFIEQIASSTGRVVSYTYTPAGDLATMTRPDGSTFTYDYDSNHRLTEARDPNGHPYVHNVYDGEGRVVKQYDQTGNVYDFSYGAALTSARVFTDPLGNAITHLYDDQYRITKEIDELGYVITYTYDSEGNVLTRRDKNGGLWQYTYDARRNRTSETDPLGHTKTYTYDANNNRTSSTDALGNTWTYEYDVQNRLIKSIDPLGYTHEYAYDSRGYLVWEKDEAGAETRYGYNTLGFQTVITAAGGNMTRMAYDAWGNQTVYTDALGHVATFVYDARNRLIESTDPLGNKFYFVYDEMGNLLSHTDGMGNAKTYTYDDHDRIVVETDFAGNPTYYEYDALGHRVVITDALGHVIRNVYDARGQLAARVDKDGGVTTFEYDPEGNLIRETDPLGRVTEYVYDALGRQIEIRTPCDACLGGMAISRKVYDAAGNVIREVAPNGAVTEYAFDALGRQAIVTDTYGATIAYTYGATGSVIQEVDRAGAVTRYGHNLSGQVITTTNALGYQSFQYYDLVGRVTTRIDELGNVTTYTYDANDNLVTTTDALGYTTIHTYDANNRRITTTDPLSRTTTTVYDANGNVVSVTDPRGNTSSTEYDALGQVTRRMDAAGGVTLYTRDAMGRLIAETNPLGHTRVITFDLGGRRVAEQTPLGYTTVYTYDIADNQIARRGPDGALWHYEYDVSGNQIRRIDPLGNERETEYDLLNRIVREVDETGAVTSSIYDDAGRLIERRDPRGMSTEYEYDLLGRQRVITDALGYTQVYTYDGAGNLVATEDARGYVTEYVYDALNRQVAQVDPHGSVRHTVFDAAGQVTASVDYEGYATRYVYDAAGNRNEVIDPYGQVTATTYDPANRPVTVVDPIGRRTTIEYNALGQVVRRTTAGGHTTEYRYDADGQQITRIDALGNSWHTLYDAHGRPVQEIDPLGRVTTTAYDPLGRAIAETDALDRVTRYRYDAVGRLKAVIGPDGTTQRYLYDTVGNLIVEQDGNGHVTRYQYDALNRPSRKIDPLGHIWTYTYDANDNETDVHTPEGHHVHQVYDALNRLTSKIYDGDPFASYDYDRNGNRVEMEDLTGRTTYTYDALNRLISSSVTFDGETETRLVQYVYDAAGQKIRLIYPDGRVAHYHYDAEGQLVGLTAPDGELTTYERDPLGRVTMLQQGNDVTVATTYDAVGNTLDITQRDADDEVFAHHIYTLDDADRRVQQVEILPQGTFTTTYAYDALDRLVHSACTDGRETRYAFDDAGNRTAMWGTRLREGITETYRVDYAYNAANQILWAKDSVKGLISYNYDADGRRTGKITPLERHLYYYDAESHLTEARVEEWHEGTWHHKDEAYERYAYDGDGRRVVVEMLLVEFDTLLGRETTLYDNATVWDVLQTYQGNGEEISDTLFLNDEFLHKLAYWQEEQSAYFQNDVLGSVLGASDGDGRAGRSGKLMRYSDYGTLLAKESILPTSDGFTGYDYEAYTSLNYARNRWYDSRTGVFLMADPYPASRKVLISLHEYLYVQAEPVNQTDRLGLFPTSLSQDFGTMAREVSVSIVVNSSNREGNSIGTSASEYYQAAQADAIQDGTAGTTCGETIGSGAGTGGNNGSGLPSAGGAWSEAYRFYVEGYNILGMLIMYLEAWGTYVVTPSWRLVFRDSYDNLGVTSVTKTRTFRIRNGVTRSTQTQLESAITSNLSASDGGIGAAVGSEIRSSVSYTVVKEESFEYEDSTAYIVPPESRGVVRYYQKAKSVYVSGYYYYWRWWGLWVDEERGPAKYSFVAYDSGDTHYSSTVYSIGE